MWKARKGLTVLVHTGVKTLLEPTGPTLVPVRLVDRTLAVQLALRLARVDAVPMDAALEEAGAAYKEISSYHFCNLLRYKYSVVC